MNLILWDIPGNQAYWEIGRQHLQGAHAIIFVYDTNDEVSFTQIDSWLEKCSQENRNENVLKILAANKNDSQPEPGKIRVTSDAGISKAL